MLQPMMNFIQPNANVRAAMGLRGFKSYQLAAALKLSRPSMSDRLSGKTDFKASELLTLSYFLQVPASSFFENTGYGFVPEARQREEVELRMGATK